MGIDKDGTSSQEPWAILRKKDLRLKKREIFLKHNLNELGYTICNDAVLNPHMLDQYEAEKNEPNSLYELKGKEAIFWSKVKWIEQGEKPTKYFFNLKKKNYVTKTLFQIKLHNGEITSDMKKINKQIEVFFSETYKSKLTDGLMSCCLNRNRPFYRYGGHIELIRFKEYYRMPRGHERISFAFSSAFRDIFS